MSRIVLFGATGYTGRLTARALADRAARPLLAGRRRHELEVLAAELGDLDFAQADATRPETVRALLEPGDVLVTTVGPMRRWGRAALEAAIAARAHYVDSSGESAWVREVFDGAGPRATAAGVVLLPAMAYDSAPGNLAGALAVRDAGGRARRVRIGYFVAGGGQGLRAGLRHMSGGSRATFARMALERGFAFRRGRVVGERSSARVGRFDVGGTVRGGVSFGTSEMLSLPRLYPALTDVEVYFGWFDRASRLLQAGALALAPLTAAPPVRRALLGAVDRGVRGEREGPSDPSGRSLFVAEALAGEEPLATVVLEGINGYAFSGNALAWAAWRLARGAGALGPVEAFGVEGLEQGVAEAGIARVRRASHCRP